MKITMKQFITLSNVDKARILKLVAEGKAKII